MASQPDGTVPSDEMVKIFDTIVKEAFSETFEEFINSDLSQKRRRKQLLRRIKKIADTYQVDLEAWADVAIPMFYEEGMRNSVTTLAESGIAIRMDGEFTKQHKESLEALIIATKNTISQGMTGLQRSSAQKINQAAQDAIVRKITVGSVKGEGIEKIQREIKKELQKEGFNALQDRGGRDWSLKRYGEMVARTTLTNAHTRGTVNQMTSSGYHLVQVSDHGGECALCRPWENEILSVNPNISAPYTSLETAKSAGLFHPQCRHTIVPYTELSARNEGGLVWDANEQEYRPWKEVSPQNYQRAKSRDVKDVLKQHERITSEIGIKKYKKLNDLFQSGDKQGIRDFAKSLDDATQKRVKKLLNYL